MNSVDKITAQCDVLEDLCKGHCILHIEDIIESEIENFLKKEFKIIQDSDFDQGYPYGTGVDCINFDINFQEEKNSMPALKKKEIKSKVMSVSKNKLSKLLPNSDNLSKKEIVKLLTCDKSTVKKYIDKTVGFKPLFLKYRSLLVSTHNPNDLFIAQSEKLLGIMEEFRKKVILGYEIIQEKETKSEKQETKRDLEKRLEKQIELYVSKFPESYKKHLYTYIKGLCKNYQIDENQALSKLGDFDNIKGIKFFTEIFAEYFRMNSGFSPNPRNVDINDYFDIQHLRNLPYIDCYVTERYFGDIASNISKKYNICVFKNLEDLKSHLEDVI